MKPFIKILFFVLLCIQHICAQETVTNISPAQFDPINQILIGTMDGWYFKKGNDSSWAGKEFSTTGWEKLKPIQLSAKMADEHGRLEGWFRLKIKLDTAFTNSTLGLRYSGWAAADIYIDGIMIQSNGNTGVNGKPFKEFNPSNRLPMPLTLQPGVEHTIAIHLVEYTSTFTSNRLKSEVNGLHMLVRFIGPQYYSRFSKHIREWPVYSTLWVSICASLTLLFFLLAFLNPEEKNLRLFAICSTSFSLQYLFKVLSESNEITFSAFQVYLFAATILLLLGNAFSILIVARVFKTRTTKVLISIIILYVLTGIIAIVFKIDVLFNTLPILPFIIYSWYIITSWKTLHSAQWAIVIGILFTLLLACLYFSMILIYKTDFIPYNMLIVTGMCLGFPLSLLIYVALRFKEIIRDVRLQAAQVLKLSEEKRNQAEKQQKLLEEEVAKQTIELRTSLQNLKSTQSQLIQSEKMASLGELTAGIAHEIQNPLNFVNNFSEVSNELIDEMKVELDKGDINEAKTIADDVKQNLQKINHHGKRADAIVKGMLQHSRSSSGIKEPTDINALCDEYLRLTYHGLRAKDKSFNAKFESAFDTTLMPVKVIAQDIGRVVLNLLTNAFYAVNEKRQINVEGYEPKVQVTTRKINNSIEIRIADNGNGIPQKVLAKIFQPFFTTKPTGQGTGLGLSLSYDIISKGHGGELKVETKEGEGCSFIILLPTV